ncbi:DUF2894 domain-containing protein [Ramlibacter sp. WS9]|uniref:DUF2894 domain-containing protein n=1 Tax=Ramlibacter sp. WS9 TaxID=1882741 RepID=UPI001141AFC5|nr:DUF2894 domain-containing protein [Ramlibacter sp. WS9]ROZ77643.1 DUF2894 domain-containing protein [Ramlibacter sp. WS9]
MSESRQFQAGSSPLAQLNHYIRSARAAAHEKTPLLDETLDERELLSARRFRQAWEACRTHDDVEEAIARKPANAGPLNSHVLVLQALGMMQTLSPEYLRRFLAHVEALQWLELARDKYPRPQAAQAKAAKPARRSRQKK